METSNTSNENTSKCQYYPRIPYTHAQQSMDYCCIGCDKPGIGSNQHDPSDNSCNDMCLCCCPCALILDILCFCPMMFGCYTVENQI